VRTFKKLPVFNEAAEPPRGRRHPDWIKVRIPSGENYFDVRELVHGQKLNTVCESASCPNIGECWDRRALTIMILGNICTRSCQFCDVPNGRPLPADPDEPRRVALTLSKLGLKHTVITSVDRDDMPDGGAAHWAETIRQVKAACPEMTLEVLVGDFKGNTDDVDTVLAARPDVFAHNLETVPRLSRQVRVQARYVTPVEFAQLKDEALAFGITHVESGPLVRSSYHADGQADLVAAIVAKNRAAG